MWRKLPLYLKILIGMAVGVLLGVLAVISGIGWLVCDYIKPFGIIFLNLLKLVAMPLIFASLVTGIAGLSDITKLSRIGVKTISLYLITTVLAITVGLLLVNMIKPGQSFPEQKRVELLTKYAPDVSGRQLAVDNLKSESPLQFLVDIIPDNIVSATSNNANMLQVIFFAMVFGLAIVMVKHPNVVVVRDFVSGLNEVILKIIDFIMRFAPFGVMALLAALIVDFSGDNVADSLHLFTTLGLYAIVVIAGLLFVALVLYPIFLKLFSGIRPIDFYRTMFPVQLVAFSTSSSAATLPVTMDRVEKGLGVSNEITSFVLPIGVTINMDGTSLYQAVAAVFIAQVFGIDLTFTQQLTIVLTATLASIGAAGVPGAGIVMLIIVLNSVGLPVEGLALILAIDRPLDMLRTVLNVTGDAMVATMVAKTERAISSTTAGE
ncbi:MAG TPA: dicarboxylate/amino acid:cation symporter [Tenuifilaceae bacterium]|jgi:Na+/H+-dicarboxylate symporter|nr:dicarboxylate/amino acid:cation symporter [Bacteroidales bacterium]MDI9516721.1 dicarboxylate/amino acid:cation symporter [Bacteroidota bacterium]NLH56959.1 dicarboxylate/amino acid:cation symporter [Rikenellaceae bacterium]OQC61017.1 MAG: Proton glutamate symport protein [Bacteroidetes bacterium ADurb.Bin008]HNV82031.1 dicarboxylate/amino acid:cation symporter [Tenuifilaceae bacterium]